MKKIKNNTYIESSYPGVTVGAICFAAGTILIDAPLRPEDSHSWLAALGKAKAKQPMILVNLDSHPDRSLGNQELHSPLMQHEAAAMQSKQRAAIFKSLKQESGADWEELDGLGSLKWQNAELLFEGESAIRLGEEEVLVREAPGPGPGSCWVEYKEGGIVFVGDCVTKGAAPFLGDANLEDWIASIDRLLSKEYKGYRIIASRGGEVSEKDIRATRKFLVDVNGRLARLAKRKAAHTDAGKLAQQLFDKYKFAAKNKRKYLLRLKQGLQNYYIAEYFPNRKVSY